MAAVVPRGHQAPPEKLEWGRSTPVALPLLSDTFQVSPAPFYRGEGQREGLSTPSLAHPERQDSRLDSCACVMCHGGEGTQAPRPHPCPLLLKAGHHTGPGTPEWAQAAG